MKDRDTKRRSREIAQNRQIAALPVRRKKNGDVEVLLVTSRDTGRWIIPKGWPWRDHADHEAAAGEAEEEAGVTGKVEKKSFGTYVYGKRLADRTDEISVDVYLLWVNEVLKDWPERAERRRVWRAPEAAAEAVEEPQLRALLRSVADLPPTRGT